MNSHKIISQGPEFSFSLLFEPDSDDSLVYSDSDTEAEKENKKRVTWTYTKTYDPMRFIRNKMSPSRLIPVPI